MSDTRPAQIQLSHTYICRVVRAIVIVQFDNLLNTPDASKGEETYEGVARSMEAATKEDATCLYRLYATAHARVVAAIVGITRDTPTKKNVHAQTNQHHNHTHTSWSLLDKKRQANLHQGNNHIYKRIQTAQPLKAHMPVYPVDDVAPWTVSDSAQV